RPAVTPLTNSRSNFGSSNLAPAVAGAKFIGHSAGDARRIHSREMPKISAILHTSNDAQRIGRALESLRPCDEVVVIDHDSTDGTAEVARKQGATVRTRIAGVQPGAYVHDLSHDWVLSLQPNEALSESLEASLLEWKQGEEPPP